MNSQMTTLSNSMIPAGFEAVNTSELSQIDGGKSWFSPLSWAWKAGTCIGNLINRAIGQTPAIGSCK